MKNTNLKAHQLDATKEILKNAPGHSQPFADQIGNYQRNIGLPEDKFKTTKVYISGSGIAGLSAAYYLIRDGQIPGENITFLEQLNIEGGSLDGTGDAEKGFIVRGGREMDFTYENFWDMFQDIPAVELPEPYSILDEYRLCNDNDPNYSKARLIHNKGEIKDFSKLGIAKKDQLAVVKLLLKKKDELDDMTIEDYFSKDFLESNFWTFWRTMFAFENWQSLLELKLYMHRFLHAIDGLNDMSSLVFPKYNQYDTFVKPLREFLVNKGVKFQFSTIVKDLEFQKEGEESYVNAIVTEQNGSEVRIPLTKEDLVFVTTGSMTEDTRYADSNTTPKLDFTKENMGTSTGWTVWNNLAKKSEIFGKPEKFNKNVEKSTWMSATLTCKPSAFTEKLKEYCINDPYSGKTATGGIITITDSNWLMSFTINRQPHFPTQPKDTLVVWAYALLMDKKGNFIEKTMPECTGHEILSELAFHLGLEKNLDEIKEKTIVRTAYMPYITSMFMPRAKGDRPEIVPAGYKNLGLLGQFVETANDVVFTMESSVRSARVAVYTLLDSNKKVPDINPLQYDIRHLLKAANTLNDNRGFPGSGLLHKVLKNTYFEHILPEIEEDDDENKSFLAQQWENLKNLF